MQLLDEEVGILQVDPGDGGAPLLEPPLTLGVSGEDVRLVIDEVDLGAMVVPPTPKAGALLPRLLVVVAPVQMLRHHVQQQAWGESAGVFIDDSVVCPGVDGRLKTLGPE